MEKNYLNGRSLAGRGNVSPSASSTSSVTLIYKLLICLFALIIVLLVCLAMAMLITQKPVDLTGGINVDNVDVDSDEWKSGKGTEANCTRFARRRKFTYRKFTMDDAYMGKTMMKELTEDVSWRRDGSLLKKKEDFFGMFSDGVVRIPPGSREELKFLDSTSLLDKLSSDEKYAYKQNLSKKVFRHSNIYSYDIVRVEDGKTLASSWPVGPKGSGSEDILLFMWNPNPKAHDFIFIHDYNIYYQEDPENPGSAIQITTSGQKDLRYGIADWLNEEEILSKAEAVWWSDSGRYISYARYDDRDVNKIYVVSYSFGNQYPNYEEISYPKTGVVNNPFTNLYIWDKANNQVVEAMPPDALRHENQSFYVLQNKWLHMPSSLQSELGPERLLTIWSNREQTIAYFTLCGVGDCRNVHQQTFVIGGQSLWVEPGEFEVILESKKGFFVVLPRKYSDLNIYNHIAHIELLPTGVGKIRSWVGGAFDIVKVFSYDAVSDTLTFASTGSRIAEMKLYRAYKATTKTPVIQSLSSLLPNCNNGHFTVSPTGKRATIECQSEFEQNRLFLIDVINPNDYYQIGPDTSEKPPELFFDLPEFSYETITLPSGYEAEVRIMKPPHFNKDDKYPVLVEVYGGPNSNRVQRSAPSPQLLSLCSSYGIVIIWIDVRGTARKGWNIKAPVYKHLGEYESADTIDGTNLLLDKYPYLDRGNVAIFGWSYGGYLSTWVGANDQGNTFKCIVSVAPVTNWLLYDSAYTERYMGMPMENLAGYNRTSLFNVAENLRNVRYFLAHGEMDGKNCLYFSEIVNFQTTFTIKTVVCWLTNCSPN
ncbi:hypothetical protein WR25_23313 isoform F [Diploscapter pachys]|uniref:Dipeptidylpeptidase IV N-terminal domain-containing protein n=1 Tax=Diploscapter pachys TaxID=2018661 RepID=A0A2A2J7V1_9BILA|nr:hypothetical protein WR25_23313 isoform F [Diploscapter pachys]